MLVVRGLAHEAILSCDTIIAGKGKLDYQHNCLQWHGRSWELQGYPNYQLYAEIKVRATSGHPIIDKVLEEHREVFQEDGGKLGYVTWPHSVWILALLSPSDKDCSRHPYRRGSLSKHRFVRC